MGINEEGKIIRVGGWGALLGDEGSGYSIAVQGVKNLMTSLDGRIGPTLLQETIFAALNAKDMYDIRDWAIKVGFQKDQIAALAPCVFKAFRNGDALAAKIIHAEGSALRRAVCAGIRSLGLKEKMG